MALRKTLSTIGSSLGLIIDKPLLDALGISKTTILDLSIDDGALIIRVEPKRSASSRAELQDWARSLLVRLAATSEDLPPLELAAELERFAQLLPTFDVQIKAPATHGTRDLQGWMNRVVTHLIARKPAPKPIITRQVALAVLEELADARGTFREITAARPFANASPDVVAGVLWFLLAHGHVEVHADSSTIRPVLERLRQRGRIPESLPDSLADSFKNGVTLLRMTALGGEHLDQLRRDAGDQPG